MIFSIPLPYRTTSSNVRQSRQRQLTVSSTGRGYDRSPIPYPTLLPPTTPLWLWVTDNVINWPRIWPSPFPLSYSTTTYHASSTVRYTMWSPDQGYDLSPIPCPTLPYPTLLTLHVYETDSVIDWPNIWLISYTYLCHTLTVRQAMSSTDWGYDRSLFPNPTLL